MHKGPLLAEANGMVGEKIRVCMTAHDRRRVDRRRADGANGNVGAASAATLGRGAAHFGVLVCSLLASLPECFANKHTRIGLLGNRRCLGNGLA